MDIRLATIGRIEHRHADSWFAMEEQVDPHRPRDTEREWREGRVFHCKQCDEHIRVVTDDDRR